MQKIVFSDVDGTLLNSRHELTPLTEQAIRTLKEQEIPFVIVSARSPSGINSILTEYDFRCPIVSYSGAVIMDIDGSGPLSQRDAESRSRKGDQLHRRQASACYLECFFL